MHAELSAVSFTIPSDVFFGGLVAMLALLYTAAMVFLGVQFAYTFRPQRQATAIDRLATNVNLVVSDEVRLPLARYVALRTRGGLLGGMIALPLVLLVLQPWADPPPRLGATSGIVAFAIVLGGTLLGALAGGLLGRRAAEGATRAARLSDLGLSELLAPVERRLMRLCVLGGVIGPALLIALLQAPWVDPAVAVLADAPWLIVAGLASAAMYLALPYLARRLVAARALAGDENALAWSDVLAARTLRDLAYLVIAVSGMITLLSALSLSYAMPSEWTAVSLVWGNVAYYLCMAAIIAAFVIVMVRKPERHVQRTLWPQFAADAQ